MLLWIKPFSIFCFLDNGQYPQYQEGYECIAGAGVLKSVTGNDLEDLDIFLLQNQEWIFGHLSYDLKKKLPADGVSETDRIGFAPYYFFVPSILLLCSRTTLQIKAEDPDRIFSEINGILLKKEVSPINISIRQRLKKEEYLEKIGHLKAHILRGDCYEINYCQEFFAEDVLLQPVDVFKRLMELSPNPFAALYRCKESYLICASPERYLSKRGDKIISQPMKGTIKRNTENSDEDLLLKEALYHSSKDRSENVMIADLVRNDLSRICKEGTVKAEELFGVYTYPQVHQMISTISGTLKKDFSFSGILEATFPMGSMTGAPKKRVMELIEEYEVSSRGIFSGSVGYFNPGGDFDFNVVIRSIMYNASSHYLSYQAGSGITFYSNPEKEWEECLLKASAIKRILTS